MQFVEPIRDERKITQIKNQLKGSGSIRDLLLFELWINSALRISDLLQIKVSDVYDNNWNPKDEFFLKEDKTDKVTRITITPKVSETLKLFWNTYAHVVSNAESYLFFHQKLYPLGKKSINRGMAWILIDRWCKWVGLKGNYGWHTLRKTRWYQARMKSVPLELIQHKLNHTSLTVTKRYLWITDDELREICLKLDL
jgi:integrase